MDMDRWHRIKEIFRNALMRKPEARDAFLEKECAGDQALRKEVEALLRSHDESGDFMELPSGPRVLPDEQEEQFCTGRIGQYFIRKPISSGGMGTVYEAVQENTQRTVAIKVMRAGITSKSALRRFEYESQILARLRHPGIAQVFEAGTHREEGSDRADGMPYFVMEYIPDATSITDYAWGRKLAISERLGLFLQVCAAVHHGHQKGIIHRDLKPSNILVDRRGTVKIIDFGIARVTDSDFNLTTIQTKVGQLLGTVRYMSPEQCRADPGDLDMRSDVYTLGVVLYELLCEELPYDVEESGILESARRICEEQPRRPSTTRLAIKNEMETIILKALEKDQAQRYQSVAELGEDIRRFLEGEVILAKPAGPATRAWKQIMRNPALSVAAGVTVTAVIAFILYILFVSYPQIMRERDIAEDEKKKALAAERKAVLALDEADRQRENALDAQAATEKEAETRKAINTFLEEMFYSADPFKVGKEVKVLEMLDRAAERLDKEFTDRPEIEASLRYTLGNTYYKNGRIDTAEHHIRRAVELHDRIHGAEYPETITAVVMLSLILIEQGSFADAGPPLVQAYETSLRVMGEKHLVTLWSMRGLAALRKAEGQYPEAEQLNRKAVEEYRRILGDQHASTLEAMRNLAMVLIDQGKLADAESLLREVIRLQESTLGETHLKTLGVQFNLSQVLMRQGKYPEAESIQRKVASTYRTVLSEEHPKTLSALNGLGNTLTEQGKYFEAEEVHREVLAIRSRLLHDGHPDQLNSKSNLAQILWRLGRYDEAETYCQEVVEGRLRYLEEENPVVLNAMSNLANVLYSQGKLADAESIYRDVLRIRTREMGEENPATLDALNNLANLLRVQGKLDEAESFCRKALKIRLSVSGEKHPATLLIMYNLARVLFDLEKLTEAESLSRKVMEGRRSIYGEEHPSTIISINVLGDILSEQGRFSEAETLFEQGLDRAYRQASRRVSLASRLHASYGRCLTQMERFEEAEDHLLKGHQGYLSSRGPDHRMTHYVIGLLIQLYESWEKPDKAEEWMAKIGA